MDELKVMWRVGRKVGRTIYAIIGPEPDEHPLIGTMDSRELAVEAVLGHNLLLVRDRKQSPDSRPGR